MASNKKYRAGVSFFAEGDENQDGVGFFMRDWQTDDKPALFILCSIILCEYKIKIMSQILS